MFRVFLVDDETIMCNGLVNLIDWKSLSCEVCGTASNGNLGLEKILELKPDIVISDICMPQMDGLEMAKKINDAHPRCKIIIVTAYRKFNYAYDAVRLRVFDLILKPFKMKTIEDSIDRAVIELKRQLLREEELSKLKENYNKLVPVLKDKKLFDVLMGITTITESQKEIKEYCLELSDYILITCRISKIENQIEDESLHLFGIVNTFNDMFSEKYTVKKVQINSRQCSFIFSLENPNETLIMDKFYQDISDVVNLIHEYFHTKTAVGISSLGFGLQELATKYNECIYALEQVENDEQFVMMFDDLKHLYHDKSMVYWEDLQSQLVTAVQLGKREKANELIQSVSDRIKCSDIANQELVMNFIITTYKKIEYIKQSLQCLVEDNSAKFKNNQLPSFTCLDSAYNYLVRFIDKAAGEIQGFNNCKTNVIVLEAVSYMEKNFQNPIMLSTVADEVHVSIYYLSRLFKKQYNQTFSDYLTNIRMHHAKEYLKNSNYKTYEVGELVGINDPHYFSKCFKKSVGITPTIYREKTLNAEL